MGEKDPLSFRARQEVHERVESFAERNGMKKSEAAERLTETGLRERERPLLHRWRDQLLTWAGFVMVVAILSIVAGAVGMVRVFTGVKFGVAALLVALIMITISEAIGFATGQSELGAWFRDKLGMDEYDG